MKELRKEILETAHLNSAKDLARKYWKESKIDFVSLKRKDFDELSLMVQIEIDLLTSYPDYSMIPKLQMKPVEIKKDGVFLTVSGSYFKSRQGISFELSYPMWIGFCGELNGCNQTPFIVGFIKWVDKLCGEAGA